MEVVGHRVARDLPHASRNRGEGGGRTVQPSGGVCEALVEPVRRCCCLSGGGQVAGCGGGEVVAGQWCDGPGAERVQRGSDQSLAVALIGGGLFPPADQIRARREDLSEPRVGGIQRDANAPIGGQGFRTTPLRRAEPVGNGDHLCNAEHLAVVGVWVRPAGLTRRNAGAVLVRPHRGGHDYPGCDEGSHRPGRQAAGLVEVSLQIIQPQHGTWSGRKPELADLVGVGGMYQPPLGQHGPDRLE